MKLNVNGNAYQKQTSTQVRGKGLPFIRISDHDRLSSSARSGIQSLLSPLLQR
ncbi:hypothetical protein YSA_08546 [Pseudomonas putida ND6]|uniref:Uncharacterized protein n=1 Tax=Pseudomonas putida ND6 TaxID=231023 RepID=I3V0W5_PSEPU|nr:hypothetical protein YSA_08546 [Pseudomonas putida ND6]